MSDMNMYNILGKFNNVDPKMTPVNEEVKTEPVYESVEPRGDIMEAVKSLEEKYMGFKKTVAAVKKGGSAEDPEAVAAAIGRKKYSKEKFQKAAAAGKKLGEAAKPDYIDLDKDGDKKESMKKAAKDAKKKTDEAIDPELLKAAGVGLATGALIPAASNLGYKAAEKIDKWLDKRSSAAAKKEYEAERQAKLAKKSKKVAEGEYDPAPIDPAAVEKRKRLQAIKDRQEAEREHGSDHKSNVRTIKGKAYGGAAQKDDEEKDLDESGLQAYLGKKKYGKEGMKALQKAGREGASKEKMAKLRAKHDKMDEVAPPGAKAERMVKHIKKGYAKDGKLTKREKGIAYATAWKAHNKGQIEEGTKFSDIVKNSKAEMKKAKPAMVKEGRVMEETDYFYEKVGKALAEKNPTLNTADPSFVAAVRKEMVAQGMDLNRARNIIDLDEDFIGDVATSYAHNCKEIAECGSPMNSFVEEAPMMDAKHELDEIARLAGLPVKETEVYDTVNHEETPDNMDEAVGQTPMLNGKAVDVNSIEVDGVHTWDSPDFADAYITYAEYADGTPLSDDELDQLTDEHGELVNQAAHGSLQGRADFVDEDTVGEGNEFSGALAKARAAGAKEFEVDGKKYTVKEGQVNEDATITVSATLEDDAINMLRKLAGMQSDEFQPATTDLTVAPVGNVQTGDEGQEVGLEEERNIEYTNTPREETAGLDAAIPAGADLNRAKKQYKKEYPGDNPMAVKEEALWRAYESMINDVKL